MSYYIHETAYAEIDELKRATIRRLSAHLITLEQAQRTFMDGFRQIIGRAYCDTPGDVRNVPIQCTGCGKVVVVASDVMRYKCRCSPNIERYAFQSRQIDVPIGQTGLQRLQSYATGREVLTTP